MFLGDEAEALSPLEVSTEVPLMFLMPAAIRRSRSTPCAWACTPRSAARRRPRSCSRSSRCTARRSRCTFRGGRPVGDEAEALSPLRYYLASVSLAAKLAPPGYETFAQGLFGGAKQGGGALGVALGGLVYERAGGPAAFWAASATCVFVVRSLRRPASQ